MVDPEVVEGIERIRSDRRRGASQLSIDAVNTLKLVVEKSMTVNAEDLIEEMRYVGRQLIEARPSMAPVKNRVTLILREIEEAEEDISLLKRFLLNRINKSIEEYRDAVSKISEYASKLIEGKTLMTHSYSSTVIDAIRRARAVRVVATESRPLYEGRRLAEELSVFNVPVTLITDASMGHFLPQVDIVLVGADTVLTDGSIVNKIGTYPMSLAAMRSHIPFYVVCETYKFGHYTSEDIELEEKEISEVLEDTLIGVDVRNIYFDITPAELIKSIVTEKGVLKPSEVDRHLY